MDEGGGRMNLTPQNEKASGQGGIFETTNQNQQSEFSYSSAHSVKGRVLGALLRGERISHLDCWRRFGSSRLSHHIYVLRGSWPIQMIEETVTTSDAGRPATIGIYFLSLDVIADAGERGQQFAADALQVETERRAA